MKHPASRFVVDIGKRDLRPEWMDQPGLDVELHKTALRALNRVNLLSRVHARFWNVIRAVANQHPNREIRVLDVASGGGDVAIRLAQAARRSGIRIQMHGCDVSPTAIAFAQDRASRARVDCQFFQLDVLRDEWPGDYDIVGNSLFLHHLTFDDAILVLRRMASSAGHSIIVNDLVRSYWGLLLASVVSRFLTRSPVVHSDGPVSVTGAFTLEELREMAALAGLTGATVDRCWPARMVLCWNKQ